MLGIHAIMEHRMQRVCPEDGTLRKPSSEIKMMRFAMHARILSTSLSSDALRFMHFSFGEGRHGTEIQKLFHVLNAANIVLGTRTTVGRRISTGEALYTPIASPFIVVGRSFAPAPGGDSAVPDAWESFKAEERKCLGKRSGVLALEREMEAQGVSEHRGLGGMLLLSIWTAIEECLLVEFFRSLDTPYWVSWDYARRYYTRGGGRREVPSTAQFPKNCDT
ncbi:hypothetical protein PHISP_06613 [Aspergillus sp. HF37]|nr:hypothetical protein PHISP_06613 [Aspergillus sp. HF37]